MIKYIPQDTSVTFSEIPDEITLCFNISNCCNNCKGCHSAYLKQNIGAELTIDEIDGFIKKNDGITCVCFMGEGNDPEALQSLILHIKEKYPTLKIGLYSGRENVDEDFYWDNLNYLKIGPYRAECGPLNVETTNQRMYYGGPYYSWVCGINGRPRYGWKDITSKFWKNDS